ncbi:nuclear transport factor 2 family protein [Naumannella sp. ID2617S]|nr:nuclear transport factor 2 family protein [Naumannella sp. ID2617S]
MDLKTDTVTHLFADADQRADLAAIGELLAEDCVLDSPITDAFVFEGRRSVLAVYAAAFELFCDIRVHTVLAEEQTGAFFITGRLDGIRFEECQLLRIADGEVCRITMIGRPVPALLRVMARIGAPMQRHGLLSPVAAVVGGGVRPIADLLRLVEQHVLPRLRPRRL